MKYKYLKNIEINREKWNSAISQSFFPLTYAYSWYLDSVAPFWDAIISEDYSFLMPLPYYTKFNNIHIYQPLLIPRLGYFYSEVNRKFLLKDILFVLEENVIEFEIVLNKYNESNFQYGKIVNYYSLDLYKSYSRLRKEYSAYLKKIISSHSDGYIVSSLSPNEVIEFLNSLNYFADKGNYTALRQILSYTTVRRLSRILGYYSDKNELLGVAVFVFSPYTVDLLVLGVVDDREDVIARLIDRFINDSAGKIYTLNFDCLDSEKAIKLYPEFNSQMYYNKIIYFKKRPKIFRFLSKNKD